MSNIKNTRAMGALSSCLDTTLLGGEGGGGEGEKGEDREEGDARGGGDKANIMSRRQIVLRGLLTLAQLLDIEVQHTATRCNTLQHAATRCNMLQHTAAHCNTLQHTVICCNTLQYAATRCNMLQHAATHCNALQRTAAHCNTLQHTATHGVKRIADSRTTVRYRGEISQKSARYSICHIVSKQR